MANVWTPAVDLINGDFETGDFTNWTNLSGNPRIKTGMQVDGGQFSFKGGAADDNSNCRQVLAIPLDAHMASVHTIVGRDSNDDDQGAAYLRFQDIGNNVVGGIWLASNGSLADEYNIQTAQIFIPADAVTCQIFTYALKGPAGTANNGIVTQVAVDWLQGPDAITLSGDVVVNGGFETGDFTGWTVTAGVGFEITTDADYVVEGTYAAFGGANAGSTIVQNIGAPPVDALGVTATAWLSNKLADDTDELKFSMIALDGASGELKRQTLYGVPNRKFKRAASMYFDLPAGTASVQLELESIRNTGGTIQQGVDAVTAQWVLDPVPIPGPGPYITRQPEDWQAVQDSEAQFYVDADGGGPITYQWYKFPDELLVGETGKTLRVIASGAAAGNSYYCIATDLSGPRQTNLAKLTLAPVPTVPEVEPILPIVIPSEVRKGRAKYDWPCSLPGVLVNSNGYSPKDVVAKNPLSSGPPLFVLEDDNNYVLYDVAWSFDAAQMQVFRGWFRSTIAGGSRLFNIELYVDGFNGVKYTQTNECYFYTVYKATQVGRRWHVAATLLAPYEYDTGDCFAQSVANINAGFEQFPDLDIFPESDPVDVLPDYDCAAVKTAFLNTDGAIALGAMEDDVDEMTGFLPDLTGNGWNLVRGGSAGSGDFVALDGGALDVCKNQQWYNPEGDGAYWFIDQNVNHDIRLSAISMAVVFRSDDQIAQNTYVDILNLRPDSRPPNGTVKMRINDNMHAVRLIIGDTEDVSETPYINFVIPQDGKTHILGMTYRYSPLPNSASVTGYIDGVEFSRIVAGDVDFGAAPLLDIAWGNAFGVFTQHAYFLQFIYVGAGEIDWAILRQAQMRNNR